MSERRAYEEMARVGRALAGASRLELLDLLSQRSWSVEELARTSGASVASTSQNLKVLREAKLVSSRRDGRRVVCSLAPGVDGFLVRLRLLADASLPELTLLRAEVERQHGPAFDAEELLSRHARGEVEVIDVRPADEFAAGHLSGARSIPLAQLQERIGELPRDRDVVAYCRGPWCGFARDAVRVLRAHGYTAERLELGVSDFRARGVAEEAA